MNKRRWYTSVVVLFKNIRATFSALNNYKMGIFIPLVSFLLLGAMVLWLVNTIAPLAPFVYSLF